MPLAEIVESRLPGKRGDEVIEWATPPGFHSDCPCRQVAVVA
jgi:hypothetical protein